MYMCYIRSNVWHFVPIGIVIDNYCKLGWSSLVISSKIIDQPSFFIIIYHASLSWPVIEVLISYSINFDSIPITR